MDEKRAVLVSRIAYDELKHIAATTDKFLYQLIDECIEILKENYNESTNINRK